ncbi:MAG: IS1 family transposase [Candidatus Sulfotelmatobacter sp.]
MNRLSIPKRAQVLSALVEGNSINAIVRMTGVAKHTVLKLLEDAGCAAAAYHDAQIRNVYARRVQVDEAWAFCYAKQKNVPQEKQGQFGYGDVWTWAAICADSKLIISYVVGTRGPETARVFIDDLAKRVANRIQLTSDGYRVYENAVENAFGCEVDYSMLVKIYGAPLQDDASTRYSPATCIGCRTATISGNPDPAHVSTSFVERQNLSMRMGMRRFTRLTNGFSKKIENHGHAVALHFFYYNFIRIHQTIRVTPAMEAGLTDHVWSFEELIALLEPRFAVAS